MAKRFPKPRKWYPKNVNKYSGDPNNIWTRSSWETRFMNYCDTRSSVVSWCSEETKIPYICGTDNKRHTYYVDFKVVIRNKEGINKTYLVEIKPYNQTIVPIMKRNRKTFLNEATAFVKNKSKWNAASNYAKTRGWEFIILTEYELGLK